MPSAALTPLRDPSTQWPPGSSRFARQPVSTATRIGSGSTSPSGTASAQIGNSVPPPLARAVAASILKADGIAPITGAEVEVGEPFLLTLKSVEAERHFGITERVIPQRNRRAS